MPTDSDSLAGAVASRDGFRHVAPAKRQESGQPYTNPERLRLALDDLDPTYIKIGQLLSSRPDLLPAPDTTELSRLPDDANPVVAEQVRQTIRQELGSDPEGLFASSDWTSLASASIGQAHAATLGIAPPWG